MVLTEKNSYFIQENADTNYNLLECIRDEKSLQIVNAGLVDNSRKPIKNYVVYRNSKYEFNKNQEVWFGDVVNGIPYGFGEVVDQEKGLLYSGCMLNGKKALFGKEYYKASRQIQYTGTFINGLRHGMGREYDLNGNLIYDGLWFMGERENDFMANTLILDDENRIHNFLHELVIGNNCFQKIKKIALKMWPRLQTIQIGDNSFKNIDFLNVENCDLLNSIYIGKNSFNQFNGFIKEYYYEREAGVTIKHCKQLKRIEIGQLSFGDFAGGFELKDLPALTHLIIGSHENCKRFGCFSWLETLELENLPQLSVLSVGRYAFCFTSCVVLKSIRVLVE